MLEPAQAFRTLLGLVQTNDWEIFDELQRKHPNDFPEVNRSSYRIIGESIRSIVSDYDYTRSPEFTAAVSRLREAAVRMKASFESAPVKRAGHRERLFEALRELPKSRGAYQLVDPSKHVHLDRILLALDTLERSAS